VNVSQTVKFVTNTTASLNFCTEHVFDFVQFSMLHLFLFYLYLWRNEMFTLPLAHTDLLTHDVRWEHWHYILTPSPDMLLFLADRESVYKQTVIRHATQSVVRYKHYSVFVLQLVLKLSDILLKSVFDWRLDVGSQWLSLLFQFF